MPRCVEYSCQHCPEVVAGAHFVGPDVVLSQGETQRALLLLGAVRV
jgi:hypothetical protein